MPRPATLAPYLDRLRRLPFLWDVVVRTTRRSGDGGATATLALRTSRRTIALPLDVRQAFLDRVTTNALLAKQAALRRRRQPPLLLFARYIPRETGERFAKAGVNFVDAVGNIHLSLGDEYHGLTLGRTAPRAPVARRPAPAFVQLCFLLLAEPPAAAWPVRRLAVEAGIGKTAAASGLQRLKVRGLLSTGPGGTRRLADPRRLAEQFVRGYATVLRPHLEIGRYRGPERDPHAALRWMAERAGHRAQWALTGTPAAYVLDRFYLGGDLPLFVNDFGPDIQRALRLVPDRAGPVPVLRAFGRRWRWREARGLPLAHPWLVYAELLSTEEPRALEAAEQFHERYLQG
jgi:hypothetical protein